MREFVGAGELARVAETVADGVARLIVEAEGVADEAADGGDLGVGVGLQQKLQPIGLRHRVVVDENGDVAARVRKPGVARHRDIGLIGLIGAQLVRVSGDHLGGVVCRGAVDDDGLEMS